MLLPVHLNRTSRFVSPINQELVLPASLRTRQRGASCRSDHYLVKGRITATTKPKGKLGNIHREEDTTKEETPPRYNTNNLENESTQILYNNRLDQKIQQIEFTNIEEEYKYIKTCIHSAA